MAVTQTPISARIKHEVLWAMNQEAMLGVYSKNEILNEGAMMFLDLLDTRRRIRCAGSNAVKRKMVHGWLSKWFPETEGVLSCTVPGEYE